MSSHQSRESTSCPKTSDPRGSASCSHPRTRNGRTYNVLATVVRHPDLLERWSAFAGHVLGPTSTLSPRDREILILRIGWLNRSEYEFGQHVLFARRAGLSRRARSSG